MATHVIQFRDQEKYKHAIMVLLEVPVSRMGIPDLKMVVSEEHIQALKRANVDFVELTKVAQNGQSELSCSQVARSAIGHKAPS